MSRLRRILPFRVVRAKLHEYAQRKRISTKYLPRLHAKARSRATHAREITRATRNRRAVRVLRPNFQAVPRPLPRLEGVPRIYLPRVQLRSGISRRLRTRRRASARLFGAFNGSGEYYSLIIKTQPNKKQKWITQLGNSATSSSRKTRPKYASSTRTGYRFRSSRRRRRFARRSDPRGSTRRRRQGAKASSFGATQRLWSRLHTSTNGPSRISQNTQSESSRSL